MDDRQIDDREVIEAVDRPGEPAMSHFAPVMLALVEAGNEVVWRNENFGFIPQPHGWTAELASPIDFDLVERRFVLPDTVRLDRDGDRIWDDASQAVVLGGEAARRAREDHERHRA
ncbi:MAG: hypothetical protein ACRDWY_06900 [Actinomycetes bacterium]